MYLPMPPAVDETEGGGVKVHRAVVSGLFHGGRGPAACSARASL